jgi:tRNA(Ile)-lysidine synthase
MNIALKTLLHRFDEDIRGKRFLVAVSGGVDSMVLAHILKARGFHTEWAHCNFGLRGQESDGDEAFVRAEAKKAGVKLHVKQVVIEGKSGIQEKARKARYAWFRELLRTEQLDFIAVAHHEDDNVESFFLELIRGAGYRGLKGMDVLKDNIFRPLLRADKSVILDYAREHDISWREDSTNASDDYTRNLIRNRILPLMREINPGLNETLSRTMVLMGEAERMGVWSKERFFAPLDGLRKLSAEEMEKAGIVNTVMHYALGEEGFTPGEAAEAAKLLGAQTGKRIRSGDKEVVMNRGQLEIHSVTDAPTSLAVASPGRYEYGDYEFWVDCEGHPEEAAAVAFQPGAVKFPITIRSWNRGDRIRPIGMTGSVKLSDLFVQRKIALPLKQSIPVWECREKLMWVTGLSISREFASAKDAPEALWIRWAKKK